MADQATHKATGKRFWSGAFDPLDGHILETHPYKRAADSDFHHSHYFSQRAQQAMKEDRAHFFWVDGGKVNTMWRHEAAKPEIVNNIKSQIDLDPQKAGGGSVDTSMAGIGDNGGPPLEPVDPMSMSYAPALATAKRVVQPVAGTTGLNDPMASHAELGRLLGKTRSTQIGAMVDQYQKPAVGTAVKRIHGDLKKLATEGEPGRMWYEKSSKRILDYTQGDKDEAHKIAQLIAIYSPQTGVPTNTANAIKAYNRAKTGQKMWAGDIIDRDKSFDTIKAASDYAKTLGKNVTKVPLDDSGKRFLFARHNMKGYENIATADRDLKAHLLMNENLPFEGRKTNNFYRNLMTHIDPHMDQGSTQDLWMARAFGFHDDAVSNANKYDFMEKLTHKLGHELGWKPHQVQAAIWTAMKTRQEAVKDDVMKEAVEHGVGKMVPDPDTGKSHFEINGGQEHIYNSLMRKRALGAVLDPGHIQRSARDFSDFLDANLAHVSWEATPSKQIQHLQGLEQKPPEVKADYHKRISEALQDEHGNDLLSKYLGVLSPGTVEAPGYWEGNVNPASHTQIAATRIKKALKRPDIDTASKELMNHYADARGLLLKQDAVGYHRPFYNPQVTKANGIEYQFDKDLTGDEIRKLGQTIDADVPGTAVVPSGPRTIRVLHFGTYDPATDSMVPLPNYQPHHKAVRAALQKSGINDTLTAHERLFASDGELRQNDWKKSPHGEDYRKRLGAAGRSDVLRYVSDVLAPKVQAVDEAFAKEHGLPRDRGLEAALRQPPAEEVGGAKLQKASGGSVNHAPSDAQKTAGNYAKERLSFQGLPVSIENKRGSVRSGTDAQGKRWEARLPADYGYIRGTEGADDDHVDCFVGPDRNSPLVVVVDQRNHRTKQFDEHKCMLGYRTERSALADYEQAFSDGHGRARVGHVQSMSVDAFKKWLKHGKTRRPAASQSIVDQALNLARST